MDLPEQLARAMCAENGYDPDDYELEFDHLCPGGYVEIVNWERFIVDTNTFLSAIKRAGYKLVPLNDYED